MISGYSRQTAEFTLSVARTPCRASVSSSRQMPTRCPYWYHAKFGTSGTVPRRRRRQRRARHRLREIPDLDVDDDVQRERDPPGNGASGGRANAGV